MIRLYVNVDHVATLRQQRGTRYPDPVAAATLGELGGPTASPSTYARIAGTFRTATCGCCARPCAAS